MDCEFRHLGCVTDHDDYKSHHTKDCYEAFEVSIAAGAAKRCECRFKELNKKLWATFGNSYEPTLRDIAGLYER